jgi:hypothetical protein
LVADNPPRRIPCGGRLRSSSSNRNNNHDNNLSISKEVDQRPTIHQATADYSTFRVETEGQ